MHPCELEGKFFKLRSKLFYNFFFLKKIKILHVSHATKVFWGKITTIYGLY